MKSIEKQIKEVNELIEENKRLQKKYPSHKFGLELSLHNLEELKKEMEAGLALKRWLNEFMKKKNYGK